jgi:DNA-binding NtrC family response regulator
VIDNDGLDDIDVVVTDILMPEKDGIELLVELRERAPNLPVIAISDGGRF